MSIKSIAYWTSTGILVFVLLSGGVGELFHLWGTLDTAAVLGYPVYFLSIIGAWKILGSIAIALPRFPRLKEWAYAGIVFNMTGAAASHVFADDFGPFAFHVTVTLGLALLAVVSWALASARTSETTVRAPAAVTGRAVRVA